MSWAGKGQSAAMRFSPAHLVLLLIVASSGCGSSDGDQVAAPSEQSQPSATARPTAVPGQEVAFVCAEAPKALAIMQDTSLTDRDRRIRGLRQLSPATDALAVAQTDDPAVLSLLFSLAGVQSGLASGELPIEQLTTALEKSC